MSRYILIFIFLSSCLPAQQSQTTSKGSSGKLEDITITGEDKLKVRSEKPALELKMDINEVILPTLETEKKFLEKTPNLVDIKEAIPKMVSSSQTAAPFLTAFVKEPIASFAVKVVGVKPATWELVVTDAKGRVFKKFEGKGIPPASVSWNGRNAENRIIKVGNAYSYLVNLMDEAGNPRTLIGAPFVIHALIHQEENGLYLSITRKKLFDVEKDKIKLIDENLSLLKEVADVLKENYTKSLKVEVYGENAALAMDQAKVVAKYLTDLLILPEDQIRYSGYEDSIENHKVDVIVKNR